MTTTFLIFFFILIFHSDSAFPPDAVALITFKTHADLEGRLVYHLNEPFDYCQWRGVKCAFGGRVVRLFLPNSNLHGTLSPNSLTKLTHLRVLSLSNNSLSGPIPDLSPLTNLKSLFLSRNSFSGPFPLSLLSLPRLSLLDLSLNRLNGSLPDLNHSLLAFNVSGNRLAGIVPVSLSVFGASSFSGNPGLCGEVLNKPCLRLRPPFFDNNNNAVSPGSPLAQSTADSSSSIVVLSPSPSARRNKNKTGLIAGMFIAFVIVVALASLLSVAIRRRRRRRKTPEPGSSSEEEEKEDVVRVRNRIRVPKSGRLVFAPGEAEVYGLDQLMRGSAELLGRGTVGTTYKAVLDNQLVVTVKRLDAAKTAVTSGEAFERHMDAVGGLRHPNLVPVRAYFQARGERLVVYDYQANGSLFNLIHGSKSTRAKPLHWTSCLKISEDLAQGLAYIHNASKLIHGNIKSSNVLLGSDFEACLTDYGLATLAGPSSVTDDPDSAGYRAPEARKSTNRASAKSDVYAFGVLLLELLTGKHPSLHPFLLPTEVPEWVRAAREGHDAGEDGQLGMLTEVACLCCVTSPEQRPAMWQVLKMIQEIKESVGTDRNGVSGYS